MQYFKHMTGMRNDTRIKRLIGKYGIEGYGLYNLIIESIVGNITTETPIPELRETCEDIAEFYNGNTSKIEEIVNFMINQNLFELNEINGRVLCSKVYKFLEQSQTRSQEIRNLILQYKSVSDKNRQSVTKVIEQEQEQEQEQEFIPPTIKEVLSYIKLKGYGISADWFINHYSSKDWFIGKSKMKNWKLAINSCEHNRIKWDKENKNNFTQWPEL